MRLIIIIFLLQVSYVSNWQVFDMSSNVKAEMKYGRAYDYETFDYDIKYKEHKRWRAFDSVECISRCEKLKIKLTVCNTKKG